MISLASVAVTLAIGLVTMAHGTTCCPTFGSIDDLERDALLNDLTNGRFNDMKRIITYCYDHLNSPTNPVQDLIEKDLVNSSQFTGMDCGAVKQLGDDIINIVSHFRYNLIVENGEARDDDTYTGEDTSNNSTFDGTSNSSTFE